LCIPESILGKPQLLLCYAASWSQKGFKKSTHGSLIMSLENKDIPHLFYTNLQKTAITKTNKEKRA